jgi:Immunoglobulin I-set domain
MVSRYNFIGFDDTKLTMSNFADSVIIESSSRFQIFSDGDLVISNLQEKDAGHYKCIRSNEAGSVSGEAFLGVLGEFSKARKEPSI